MVGEDNRGRRALTPTALLLALAVAALVAALVAGCQGTSRPAAAPTTTAATTTIPVTSAPAVSPSSTVPIQASGPRTVLSPIGLNLRAQASKTAAIVGTAGQGAVLTVLSHTDGWYQVKGATTTGFITDNPNLSAEGKFTPYSSDQHNFSALYPDRWTAAETAPASVVFHPPAGSNDSIVFTTATTAGQLGRGRAGYRQQSAAVVVVCGVTGELVTLAQAGAATPPATGVGGAVPERYLVQIHLSLDPQHALGVDANLSDLAQLQTVKNVMYSISFPFPQCEAGATPNQTSSTAPITTVH